MADGGMVGSFSIDWGNGPGMPGNVTIQAIAASPPPRKAADASRAVYRVQWPRPLRFSSNTFTG
ncbi:hypothetical protein JCM14635_29130 [Megalodesulfovibrio paquesii]